MEKNLNITELIKACQNAGTKIHKSTSTCCSLAAFEVLKLWQRGTSSEGLQKQ